MYNKLKNLGININQNESLHFNKFIELFLQYNKNVNLISKNDEKYLFEKHIYDSLAYNLFRDKFNISGEKKILDIGTGGGFPALPLALHYREYKITAVDSINKKINFIKYAAHELNITNINPICLRVENLPIEHQNAYDVVVSRAVADLKIILEYAYTYIKKGGYFAAYKSKKANDEIQRAENTFKALNLQLIDKIEYSLPLNEENTRVLLIIQK